VICTAGNITGTTCNWTQTFTYWAADLCGNNASANVTYTWKEPVCCVSCQTACAADGAAGNHTFDRASSWFTYIVYNKRPGTNTTPVTYPIFAGQTHLVGTLSVYNNATTLFVNYSTAGAEPGCLGYFSGYHLQAADTYNGLKAAIVRHRNPIPGMCQYKGSVNETAYIPVNIAGYSGDIYIFAHAIACMSCF
jgi:hypothetical protein